ncbi:tRNA pseudouridine(38-40) synthase TruA, partial [Elusimicrobiota bacterium]
MDLKAVVEYEGSNYYGMQIQPGKPTVQTEIHNALEKIFRKKIKIKYSSRTDRGVHSKGQVISFKTPFDIPSEKLRTAINSCLNEDIFIRKISKCKADFHPRYDVKAKLYIYRILNRQNNDYMLN